MKGNKIRSRKIWALYFTIINIKSNSKVILDASNSLLYLNHTRVLK